MTDDQRFEPQNDFGVEPQTPDMAPAPRRRRTATIVSSIVVIVAVAAGAAFAVRSVRTSAHGGASTPVAAVQQLLDAAGREDALGVLASLVPGERDALRAPLQDLVHELSRLGVLSQNIDLSKVSGVGLTFSGLQFSTSSLDADHVFVQSTAGTLTARFDPKTVPLGEFVRNLAGPVLQGAPTTSTETLTGDNAVRLVAVRQSGHWYVSIAYSIAEGQRRDSGGPAPQFNAGIQPAGAASAEEATRTFIRSLVAFDLPHVVAVLAPDESAAIRDYAGTSLASSPQEFGFFGDHFSIDLKTLDLTSKVRADDTLVKIKRMTFTASSGHVRIEYDGTCFKSQGLPVPPSLCGNQLAQLSGVPLTTTKPDVGIVCVQVGGSWYVSPTRTVLEDMTAVLRTLKPSDLTSLAQVFERFAGGAFLPGGQKRLFRVTPSVSPLLPQS